MHTQAAFSSEDDVAIGQLPLAFQVTTNPIWPPLLHDGSISVIVTVTM